MHTYPDEQSLVTARYIAILEDIEKLRDIADQTFDDDPVTRRLNNDIYNAVFSILKKRGFPIRLTGRNVERYVMIIAGKSYQCPAEIVDRILAFNSNGETPQPAVLPEDRPMNKYNEDNVLTAGNEQIQDGNITTKDIPSLITSDNKDKAEDDIGDEGTDTPPVTDGGSTGINHDADINNKENDDKSTAETGSERSDMDNKADTREMSVISGNGAGNSPDKTDGTAGTDDAEKADKPEESVKTTPEDTDNIKENDVKDAVDRTNANAGIVTDTKNSQDNEKTGNNDNNDKKPVSGITAGEAEISIKTPGITKDPDSGKQKNETQSISSAVQKETVVKQETGTASPSITPTGSGTNTVINTGGKSGAADNGNKAAQVNSPDNKIQHPESKHWPEHPKGQGGKETFTSTSFPETDELPAYKALGELMGNNKASSKIDESSLDTGATEYLFSNKLPRHSKRKRKKKSKSIPRRGDSQRSQDDDGQTGRDDNEGNRASGDQQQHSPRESDTDLEYNANVETNNEETNGKADVRTDADNLPGRQEPEEIQALDRNDEENPGLAQDSHSEKPETVKSETDTDDEHINDSNDVQDKTEKEIDHDNTSEDNDNHDDYLNQDDSNIIFIDDFLEDDKIGENDNPSEDGSTAKDDTMTGDSKMGNEEHHDDGKQDKHYSRDDVPANDDNASSGKNDSYWGNDDERLIIISDDGAIGQALDTSYIPDHLFDDDIDDDDMLPDYTAPNKGFKRDEDEGMDYLDYAWETDEKKQKPKKGMLSKGLVGIKDVISENGIIDEKKFKKTWAWGIRKRENPDTAKEADAEPDNEISQAEAERMREQREKEYEKKRERELERRRKEEEKREKQRQAELEFARQKELEKKREVERREALELERKREEERKRQEEEDRLRKEEEERRRIEEEERKRKEEEERKRLEEEERKRKEEEERKRKEEEEREKQRKAELERQKEEERLKEIERQRQEELEKQRQKELELERQRKQEELEKQKRQQELERQKQQEELEKQRRREQEEELKRKQEEELKRKQGDAQQASSQDNKQEQEPEQKQKSGGFFSIFKKKPQQPKNDYQSIIETPTDPEKQAREEALAKAAMGSQDEGEKDGQLFMHTHTVVLSKKFGTDEKGPFTFYIWPIWITDKYAGYKYADILAVGVSPRGTKVSMVSTMKTKELYMTIDDLHFNVYGTWDRGVFESHVTLYDRTESMYQIDPSKDIVEKLEPEEYNNGFLNQFRQNVKNVGTNFVVPFEEYNRGKSSIPIAGYVDQNRKRYAIDQTSENALFYRADNGMKEIRGRWVNGKFNFTVENVD